MGAILIVMVFAFGGATEGGAATAVVKVRMLTMTECNAAARRVEREGSLGRNGFGAEVGAWRVQAVCVEGD